jgi:hypothetical protein
MTDSDSDVMLAILAVAWSNSAYSSVQKMPIPLERNAFRSNPFVIASGSDAIPTRAVSA